MWKVWPQDKRCVAPTKPTIPQISSNTPTPQEYGNNLSSVDRFSITRPTMAATMATCWARIQVLDVSLILVFVK
jgi:hypothetical protein